MSQSCLPDGSTRARGLCGAVHGACRPSGERAIADRLPWSGKGWAQCLTSQKFPLIGFCNQLCALHGILGRGRWPGFSDGGMVGSSGRKEPSMHALSPFTYYSHVRLIWLILLALIALAQCPLTQHPIGVLQLFCTSLCISLALLGSRRCCDERRPSPSGIQSAYLSA